MTNQIRICSFLFFLLLFPCAASLFSQNSSPAVADKLVLFEIFDRASCGNCKAVAKKIRVLMETFREQPVLFLEQPVDQPQGNRYQRWLKKFNRKESVTLPFVMLDSGDQLASGPMEESNMQEMIRKAMTRPSPARLEAETHLIPSYREMMQKAASPGSSIRLDEETYRAGSIFRVFLKITNTLSETITWEKHRASLQILVYDTVPVPFAGFPVRAMVSTEIFQDLKPGVTMPVILETPDLNRVLNSFYRGKIPWERLQVVALADYMPQGMNGAYDQLAAAKAPRVEDNPASK